jgi:hypothetical protein
MNYETASLDDLKTILLASIIRYKGEPAYVRDVLQTAKGFYLTISDLENLNAQRNVLLVSRFLDFTPVPLGYCNTPTGAIYLSRKPSRNYRQGLHHNNVHFKGLMYESNYFGRIGSMADPALVPTIKGDYPSLRKAVDLVQEHKISHAFSRVGAISPEGEVLFKGNVVGYVEAASAVIALRWNCEHYRKALV